MGASGHIPPSEDQTYWHMCVGGETVYNISPVLKEENGQCDSPYRPDLGLHVLRFPFSVNTAIRSKNVSAEMMHVRRAWQVGVKIYAISFSLSLSCFWDRSPGIITAKPSASRSFVSVISILYGEMLRWIVMYGSESFRRVHRGKGGRGLFVAKPRLLTVSEPPG